jgi:hypothetical protein|tara:strand:+ start:1927 stop:3177 length:1251 start_codon:yes stop_codon:yes gene_type:complete
MGGPKGVIRPGLNLIPRSKSDEGVNGAKTKREKAAADSDSDSDDAADDFLRSNAMAVEAGGDADKVEKKKKKKEKDARGDAPEVVAADGADGKVKGKKNKKERQKHLLQHLSLRAETTTPAASVDHPFEVDAADHCETPFQAYQDVEPFLFRVALALKKPKDKLRIYDPYFCEGSVAKHLARLGFTSVYNKNEDFYKCIEKKKIPEHDVLLTNPPYSGDHFRRILSFCAKNKKPWLLLLPNFVCRKQYYLPCVGEDVKALFLIPDPTKPYRYWAPGRKGFEDRNQAKGTTPFETFWYVNYAGLAPHDEVRAWWMKKFAPHSTCALPAPDEALPQQQRLQKRANPRARKIAAMKERLQGGPAKDGKGGAGIYYDPEKAKAAKQRTAQQGGGAAGGFKKDKRKRDKGGKDDRKRSKRA